MSYSGNSYSLAFYLKKPREFLCGAGKNKQTDKTTKNKPPPPQRSCWGYSAVIPSHVHPPGRLSDSGHTGPPLTSHPELRLKRGQEGKALQLPAWTPVPPLSGLSLSPGPHPEQTLRGGQQTLIPCISKEISITISLSTTPGGQPPGSQDTRRRGSDPHPPPPTSASTKFPRGLSTPTSTRLLGSSLTSQEFRSRAGHT